MVLLDLSAAEAVRMGGQDALAIRVGDALVWEAPVPPAAGPQAAYNFNEPSGPVLDRSGNGRNVTLATAGQRVASPTYEGSGAAGGGLALAGGVSGVDVAPYNAAASRTVAFRGYLAASGVWAFRWQITAIDSGAFGVYYSGGVLRGRLKRGGANFDAISTMAMPTATWVHIALTNDAATGAGQLYADGVLIASATVTGGGVLDAVDGIDIAADGGAVAPGWAMLLRQAVEQVRLMTGRPAPVEAMRTALTDALARRGG